MANATRTRNQQRDVAPSIGTQETVRHVTSFVIDLCDFDNQNYVKNFCVLCEKYLIYVVRMQNFNYQRVK